MSQMSEESHIGSVKRMTMIYTWLLLLLSIGFRMELHLCLLPWTFIEIGSLLGSPQQWYQSRWCVRLGEKGVIWWIPWTSLVKWHVDVDRAGTCVLQHGSMARDKLSGGIMKKAPWTRAEKTHGMHSRYS